MDGDLEAVAVAGEVFVFGAAGEYLGSMGRGILSRPCGLVVDPATGRLLVVDTAAHQIVVLSAEGSELERIGRRGSAPGEFNFPTNIAMDRQGRAAYASGRPVTDAAARVGPRSPSISATDAVARAAAIAAVAMPSLAVAEVGGGAMSQFKVELARWARGVMLARPAVHGLVGVRDVDEAILDEALFKFDAGLRLFHMHAEGMGTIIIVATMVAVSLVSASALRRWIIALITIGGAGYPLGYLLWSALIPFHGIAAGRRVAELAVWIPFGSAAIVAMWLLAGAVAWKMLRRQVT